MHSVSILRQRQAFAADGAIGGSGRTGDVWRRPAMPGTPDSPVDHLQAHGAATAGVAGHGRSASRALDTVTSRIKNFCPMELLVYSTVHSWDEPQIDADTVRNRRTRDPDRP